MRRQQSIYDLDRRGQSYASERKRVRLALLQAHPQFLSELKTLGQTVKSYAEGFDSRAQSEFDNRWQVTTEVVPVSLFENASDVEGDPELAYRENLSQTVNDPIPTVEDDEPVCLFWDAKYAEAWKTTGPVDRKMVGETYVAIPINLSLNEAIAFLKAAGVGEQKGYLTNTDDQGLKESISVLKCSLVRGMKIPAIVRQLHPDLDPETFKSKSTRYTKLLKQMTEIIEPPPPRQQN